MSLIAASEEFIDFMSRSCQSREFPVDTGPLFRFRAEIMFGAGCASDFQVP